MLEYIKTRLTEVSTWKGIVALIAAIVMYFTPDNVDKIIQTALVFLGITDFFTIEKKQ